MGDGAGADRTTVSAVRFDHVAQQVPDVAEAVAWYADALPGARVVYQDPTWALIEANGTRMALVIADQHPDHVAWRVSPEQLERLAARHGRPIATHRDATRSFYLEAPGGHWVEIIAYPEDDGSDA
jgi:catechol 2,3-dioxygenase-like lactoylglutathione lyase family enzyme